MSFPAESWPQGICVCLVVAALRGRCGHYIFVLFLSSFLVFSSPNLSGRRLDVYHTSTHGVALVGIWNAGLKCTVRSSRKIQNVKKHHLGTIAQTLGCIFATKACIDNRKRNLLNSKTSSTCPHNMVNFGPLTAEIGSAI